MPKVDIPVEVLKAIDAVVAYDWATEENDYKLCEHEGNSQEGHVFLFLKAIDEWIATDAIQSVIDPASFISREETT